jgi:predicted RNase H-like nuclease (RuvC/YqgF family)
MSIKTILEQLPDIVRDLPAIQMLIEVIDSQTLIIRQLQEQNQKQGEAIQKQAEQIQSQQKTIEELKDEISRLNKTPK